MSQDLFAAFGDPEPALPTAPSSKNKLEDTHVSAIDTNEWWPDTNQLESRQNLDAANSLQQQSGRDDNDNEDDFGDFEDASVPSRLEKETSKKQPSPSPDRPAAFPPKAPKKENEPQKDPNIGRHPFANHMDLLFATGDDEYDAGSDELDDLAHNPEAAMAYSKRILRAEQEQESKKPFHQAEYPTTQKIPQPSNDPPKQPFKAHVKDPNVLFDADDLSQGSEDEDFGNFEGGADDHASENLPESASMPAIDLLGLSNEATVSEPRQGSAYSTHHKNDIGPRIDHWGEISHPTNTVTEDESWDDFEVAEPSDNPKTDPKTAVTPPAIQSTSSGPRERTIHTEGQLPPTNVPPPALLLSVFPSIFNSAGETLLDPVSKLESAQRQELLAHSATHQFLRSHLNTVTTLGHIIAGRKLRWKRDQYLAQSMRIGPAGVGGKSGMKLAGVDKTELAKEEREALDAIRLWKTQAGKLRGAVTAANLSMPPGRSKLPSVPEIAEQIPVKTLKAVEGGFVAPHPCALCGLKREERAAKVDADINDSFGEWWVQGMNMHVTCREFWEAYKSRLKSR